MTFLFTYQVVVRIRKNVIYSLRKRIIEKNHFNRSSKNKIQVKYFSLLFYIINHFLRKVKENLLIHRLVIYKG